MLPNQNARKYVGLDIETGGLNHQLHALVSVSVIEYNQDLREISRKSYIVRDQPGYLNSPEAINVHHINKLTIDTKGIPIQTVLNEIRPILSGATLIGHNLAFDTTFLAGKASQNGTLLNFGPAIDTLNLARQGIGVTGGDNRLTSVAARMGIPAGRAHEATSDIETSVEIYRRMRAAQGIPAGVFDPYTASTTTTDAIKRYSGQINAIPRDLPEASRKTRIDAILSDWKAKNPDSFYKSAYSKGFSPTSTNPYPAVMELIKNNGGNVDTALAKARTDSSIPEAQRWRVIALLQQVQGGFITPTLLANRASQTTFGVDQFGNQMTFNPRNIAESPENFTNAMGDQLASRTKNARQGFNIQDVYEARMGAVNSGNGYDWQSSLQKDPLKEIKRLQQTGNQEALMYGVNGVALPVETSLFRHQDRYGRNLPQFRGNVVRMDYTGGDPFLPNGMGYLMPGSSSAFAYQDQTRFIPGAAVRDVTPQTIEGKRTQYLVHEGIGHSTVWDTGDWTRTQVSNPRAVPGGVVVDIHRERPVLGSTRNVGSGTKTYTGAILNEATGLLDPNTSPAMMGADINSIKDKRANMEASVAGYLTNIRQTKGQAGLQSYLNKLGVGDILIGGEIDWRSAYSQRSPADPGSTKFQIMARDMVEHTTDAQGHYRPYLLTTAVASGAYDWSKPQMNPEMLLRIQQTDPALARKIMRDPQGAARRSVYGQAQSLGQINAGLQGTNQYNVLDLDSGDGQNVAREIYQVANSMAAGKNLTPSMQIAAIRQVLTAHPEIDSSVQFRIGGVLLPNLRAIRYFGGGQFRKDLVGVQGDTEEERTNRINQLSRQVSPLASSALDMIFNVGGGGRPNEAQVNRYTRSLAIMSSAREMARGSTSFTTSHSWGGTVGGMVGRNDGVPNNIIVMGDEALEIMFPEIGRGRPSAATRAERLASVKQVIDSRRVNVTTYRQPNMANAQVLVGVRIVTSEYAQTNFGLKITGASSRVLVSPTTLSLMGGDADGDAIATYLRGAITFDGETKLATGYRGPRPINAKRMTNQIAYLDRNTSAVGGKLGTGLATQELRGWMEDARKFMERTGDEGLKKELMTWINGMTGGEGTDGMTLLQAYIAEHQSKNRMGTSYDLSRQLSSLSGDQYAAAQHLMAPIYQSYLDKMSDAGGMHKFMELMTGYQPLSGYTASLDAGERPISMNNMLPGPNGANNTATIRMLTGLIKASLESVGKDGKPERSFASLSVITRMITPDKDKRRELIEWIQTGDSTENIQAGLISVLGDNPWGNASELGPVVKLFRALSTARLAKRITSTEMTLEDIPWKAMGEALNAQVKVLRGKTGARYDPNQSPEDNLLRIAGSTRNIMRRATFDKDMLKIVRGAYEAMGMDMPEDINAHLKRLSPNSYGLNDPRAEKGGEFMAYISAAEADILSKLKDMSLSSPAKLSGILNYISGYGQSNLVGAQARLSVPSYANPVLDALHPSSLEAPGSISYGKLHTGRRVKALLNEIGDRGRGLITGKTLESEVGNMVHRFAEQRIMAEARASGGLFRGMQIIGGAPELAVAGKFGSREFAGHIDIALQQGDTAHIIDFKSGKVNPYQQALYMMGLTQQNPGLKAGTAYFAQANYDDVKTLRDLYAQDPNSSATIRQARLVAKQMVGTGTADNPFGSSYTPADKVNDSTLAESIHEADIYAGQAQIDAQGLPDMKDRFTGGLPTFSQLRNWGGNLLKHVADKIGTPIPSFHGGGTGGAPPRGPGAASTAIPDEPDRGGMNELDTNRLNSIAGDNAQIRAQINGLQAATRRLGPGQTGRLARQLNDFLTKNVPLDMAALDAGQGFVSKEMDDAATVLNRQQARGVPGNTNVGKAMGVFRALAGRNNRQLEGVDDEAYGMIGKGGSLYGLMGVPERVANQAPGRAYRMDKNSPEGYVLTNKAAPPDSQPMGDLTDKVRAATAQLHELAAGGRKLNAVQEQRLEYDKKFMKLGSDISEKQKELTGLANGTSPEEMTRKAYLTSNIHAMEAERNQLGQGALSGIRPDAGIGVKAAWLLSKMGAPVDLQQAIQLDEGGAFGRQRRMQQLFRTAQYLPQLLNQELVSPATQGITASGQRMMAITSGLAQAGGGSIVSTEQRALSNLQGMNIASNNAMMQTWSPIFGAAGKNAASIGALSSIFGPAVGIAATAGLLTAETGAAPLAPYVAGAAFLGTAAVGMYSRGQFAKNNEMATGMDIYNQLGGKPRNNRIGFNPADGIAGFFNALSNAVPMYLGGVSTEQQDKIASNAYDTMGIVQQGLTPAAIANISKKYGAAGVSAAMSQAVSGIMKTQGMTADQASSAFASFQQLGPYLPQTQALTVPVAGGGTTTLNKIQVPGPGASQDAFAAKYAALIQAGQDPRAIALALGVSQGGNPFLGATRVDPTNVNANQLRVQATQSGLGQAAQAGGLALSNTQLDRYWSLSLIGRTQADQGLARYVQTRSAALSMGIRPGADLTSSLVDNYLMSNYATANQAQRTQSLAISQGVNAAQAFAPIVGDSLATSMGSSFTAYSNAGGSFQVGQMMQAMQGPGQTLSNMVSNGQFGGFNFSGIKTDAMRTMQTGGKTGQAGLPIGTTSFLNANGTINSTFQPFMAGIGRNNPYYSSYLGGAVNSSNAAYMALNPTQQAAWAGQSWAGGQQLAAQTYSNNQYGFQMAGLGIQAGQANTQYAFMTGIGMPTMPSYPGMPAGRPPLQSQWAIQDQQIALQRQQASWGIQMAGAQLGQSVANFNQTDAFNRMFAGVQYGFQQQNFGLQGEGIALNRTQQLQNFGLQRNQMNMQRGFQQENWSLQQNRMNVQFGFQMRDDDLLIQRSSGFDRRQLERQKQEQVVAHNMDNTALNLEKSQAHKAWAEEDKRFNVQKTQATDIYNLTVKQFNVQKAQAAELYKLELERMNMEKQQFMANAALQGADLAKQAEFLVANNKLQDLSRDNERSQAVIMHNYQMASIGNAEKQLADQKTYNDNQNSLSIVLTNQQATLANLYSSSQSWYSAMVGWMDALASRASSGSGQVTAGGNNNTYIIPPGNAAGLHTIVPRGTGLSVGEQGPEMVYVDVYPFSNNRGSKHSNVGGGATNVHIYLDSKEITASTVKRIAKETYQGRKR